VRRFTAVRISTGPPTKMPSASIRLIIAVAAALALAPLAGGAQTAIGAADFRLLPLRIHLLRAREAPELGCALQETDARRILGKVNGIWRQAGIQFYADAIQPEDAANQALYRGLGDNRTEAHLRLVRPRESQSDALFHVYYLGEMRPNGICLAASYQLLFVKETARLYKVTGGIDEDLPRVTAHEIGHALRLPHRQDTFNLMASGTTGTRLNDAEIAAAREAAEAFPFSLEPEEALALADRLKTEGKPQAKQIYAALAGLPGGEVAKAARERMAP